MSFADVLVSFIDEYETEIEILSLDS